MAKKTGKTKSRKRTRKIASSNKVFEKQLFSNLSKNDLEILRQSDRGRLAASLWSFIQQRKPRAPKIRIFNPEIDRDGWHTKWTVIEIINDDMPFLVDSITAAVNRLGFNVHMVIHPVFSVTRDRSGKLKRFALAKKKKNGSTESCMHVQIDACVDETKQKLLMHDLTEVLSDVRRTVADWTPMRTMMLKAASDVSDGRGLTSSEIKETQEFLHWIADNNFTYIGYRKYKFGKGRSPALRLESGSGMGILRHDSRLVFNALLRNLHAQTAEAKRFMHARKPLRITKTNAVATVHRGAAMDAIFVRVLDNKGRPKFEHVFVGLFTSSFYMRLPREIPVLRQKVAHVLQRAKLDPVSHDGKALTHILNTYPRDELCQIGEQDLYKNAMGILQLQERQKAALFVRRDPFDRFVTCIIFVPRDRYDSNLRQKIQVLLRNAFDGVTDRFDVRLDDSPLARVFMIVHLRPDSKQKMSTPEVERTIQEMARAFADRLRDEMMKRYDPATITRLYTRYRYAFPPGYKAATPLVIALEDINHIEVFDSSTQFEVYLSEDVDLGGGTLHLKLYSVSASINLHEAMPIIEDMGLSVTSEAGPFEVWPEGAETPIFIQDFVASIPQPVANFEKVKPLFEEAFRKVWYKQADNDTFNRLVLAAGLSAREIVIVRTLARYLVQIRAPHSLPAIASTLARHPQLTRLLVGLFMQRHDPAQQKDAARRIKVMQEQWLAKMAGVPNIDDDRILRRLHNLVQASQRTNYFQADANGQPKTYLSIKFASREVDGLPLPKPLYEIFVHSPEVEGIHLRGGKVARGGIRWSDREDFRTEILGLMKAQQVKNAVIVPVGAKGGFVVRDALAGRGKGDGTACYKIFIRGLLDITDNQVQGKIVPPKQVVRNDAADPYLVVAADKGTAKFSDVANAISIEYGHWLGDAFASGGSQGYDHKEMGITAKGTWEAVKRHFREIGVDTQSQDFTVIGVGDMSGDVFGNGMLLSKHIRLLAAFDHRHIFCDPNPDAARSFKERERLFHQPGSAWSDYSSKLISSGGGVFSRADKTIRISSQMKAAFDLTTDSMSPGDLISALLKAPIDLLYFGGIGTLVKSSDESHEQVGDRANDLLRVDASELRAKVVGEGANLGMTQRARVEYGLLGGRLNTDAIDNSAGVDTSDHEVNIKVALAGDIARGKLKMGKRNSLLKSMTDEVERLVLRDNYLQTQALSIAHARGTEILGNHVRMMRMLEKSGLLNRKVEFLPDDEEIAERSRKQLGLTRPELAVLLAYAKIWLFDQLLASKVPDDPYLMEDLIIYFPKQMREGYRNAVVKHQLRREIIATSITNSFVNRAGSHFAFRMMNRTGRTAAEVTFAYLLARDAYELRSLWRQIEALDGKVAAHVQTSMLQFINRMLSQVVPAMLHRHEKNPSLEKHITYYRKGIRGLRTWLVEHDHGEDTPNAQESAWVEAGVPRSLARVVASMPLLSSAPDIIALAEATRVPIGVAADAFAQTGQRFGLDWLRTRTGQLPQTNQVQRDAALALSEDIYAIQHRVASAILHKARGQPVATALTKWCSSHARVVQPIEQVLTELRVANDVDYAALAMTVRQLAVLG